MRMGDGTICLWRALRHPKFKGSAADRAVAGACFSLRDGPGCAEPRKRAETSAAIGKLLPTNTRTAATRRWLRPAKAAVVFVDRRSARLAATDEVDDGQQDDRANQRYAHRADVEGVLVDGGYADQRRN